MRRIEDAKGREWSAELVGRTSGILPSPRSDKPFIEPSDIVRFTCLTDSSQSPREITAKAGLLDQLAEEELLALFDAAIPVS